MALTDKKINGSTPIREFPENYYNALIDELTDIISRKDTEISGLKATLASLKTEYDSKLNQMRAEYLDKMDQMKTEYLDMFEQLETKFVKKEEYFDMLEQLDTKFVKKEDN